MISPIAENQNVKIKEINSFYDVEFSGRIKEIQEETGIIIVKLNHKVNTNKDNVAVLCIAWEKTEKVYAFETTILYLKDDILIIRKPDDGNIQQLARRQQLRVDVDIPVTCYIQGIGDVKLNISKFLPGNIKNLSVGGILLHSRLSIPEETIMVFELPVDKDEIIVAVKILRNEEKNDGAYMGCEFLGLTEQDQQKIMNYIFKNERLKKKKEEKSDV